jgi:hypothetical protein
VGVVEGGGGWEIFPGCARETRVRVWGFWAPKWPGRVVLGFFFKKKF